MISFNHYELNQVLLKNRVVMAPMCTYSSGDLGYVCDFHKVHYGARALGGVGLIILEATAVTKNGRISSKDLGIWSDSHVVGLRDLVDQCHEYGAKMGIQLAHAGRKSMSDDEFIVAPSPIAFDEGSRLPKELTKEEIDLIVQQFQRAAQRADEAGFDLIEIHGAHGYLIHEFLSPLTNKRLDAYGGSLENRVRFLREILGAVRKVWPMGKAISLRVSADDYIEGGLDMFQMADIINLIKDYVDIVHVSTGGLISTPIKVYPGYQLDHSEYIKKTCEIPTIAVGLLNTQEQIESVLHGDQADLVALGRCLLRKPQFLLNLAYDNNLDIDYPIQYERGFL